MIDMMLPKYFDRATRLTIIVPVRGVPDLEAAGSDPTVVPERIEIRLSRDEGASHGDREYARVRVIGSQRLESGGAGVLIASSGWESACNTYCRYGIADALRTGIGYIDRPDWLTDRIIDNWPDGWDTELAQLPVHTDKEN